MPTLEKQAADLYKKYGSKAEVARELLDQGHSISEISRAVPMAYSQVHSIAKKNGGANPPLRRESSKAPQLMHGPPKRSLAKVSKDWGDLPDTRPKTKKPRPSPALTRKVVKAAKTGQMPRLSPRVGKLRTPGLPSDIDVGPCHNCGFDLVVKRAATGLLLVHVNTTTEEYLATTQFCQAVPEVLVPRS